MLWISSRFTSVTGRGGVAQRTLVPVAAQRCHPSARLTRTEICFVVAGIRNAIAETRPPSRRYWMLVGSTPVADLGAFGPVSAWAPLARNEAAASERRRERSWP